MEGVAPEIAEHLFEPFQTTKSRGMGLGLPLSRKIIEAHGDDIWWERASRKAHDSTSIYPSTHRISMQHDVIVNVVDDDAAIRDAVSVLLHIRGLRSRTFSTAEAFLASLRPRCPLSAVAASKTGTGVLNFRASAG